MIIDDIYKCEDGYIGLLIGVEGLPKFIDIAGYKLLLKSELHITLINAGAIAKIVDEHHYSKVEDQIVEEFKSFIEQHPLDSYKILHKFRFVQRDTRKTVIAMTEVPGLDQFFDRLRFRYGKEDIPSQPTHVTLYTLPPGGGIGLLSQDQINEDSESTEVPALENLRFIKIPK